jgi:hypothetical protein
MSLGYKVALKTLFLSLQRKTLASNRFRVEIVGGGQLAAMMAIALA